MTTFKTILHHYSFPSGAHPAYKAMTQRIAENADGRGRWMNSWGAGDRWDAIPGNERAESVEIDPAHLFGNQWNEAGGGNRRLFDWYEIWSDRRPEKVGHWLEITPEMAAARRDTLKCGYCAHQYGPFHSPRPDGWHCVACLDSEHLKPEDFALLRLRSVADQEVNRDRPELTATESAELMPRYVARQTTGTDSRAKMKRDKQRADVLAKCQKETADAITERDGMLWLWDRGLSLDNVIFYNHTGKFSFGWRSPVCKEVEAELMKTISEFPFPYEIKTADGRKLEGY